MSLEHIIPALLNVTRDLDRETALTTIVNTAKELTGATYAALGILDRQGVPGGGAFIHSDLGAEYAEFVASTNTPRGQGVLGAIPADEALILQDIRSHPRSAGFPPGHPPMTSFMGAPVHLGGSTYGRLYLTDKPGGFTPADAQIIEFLASAAAIAVRNSELFAVARSREKWVAVGQEITTTMLEGTEVEDALQLIADRLRQVAGADAACLVLPGMNDDWMIEFTSGERAADLVGVIMPSGGRAVQVIETGQGIVVESFQRTPSLRLPEFGRFGPALYAPLIAHGKPAGVVILLRARGAEEFHLHDLDIATVIARQAALALELAEARAAQDHATLLDERARISRDLHDMAIQQLFATGLSLTAMAEELQPTNPQMSRALLGTLDDVDDSVRQIRAIVNALRDSEQVENFNDRLEREISMARTGLGFAPSVVLRADGIHPEDVDALIDDELADDIVAVVREGLANAARHARASSVGVDVAISAEDVTITVTDDGRGIDPQRARNSGLNNLGDRARRRGGDFSLGAPAGHRGAEIRWRAPLR